MKSTKKIDKIGKDLIDMTREETRAYIKAISNGAQETGSRITFMYKNWAIDVDFENNLVNHVNAHDTAFQSMY